MSQVLVTGGSGFIASHCILQLLNAGHTVRTTVRHLKRQPEVLAMMRTGGVTDPGDRLKFFTADLEVDAGWNEAVTGCDYVLHVASPFPPRAPKDENELIRPARDGALRVLKAARDAGVKRVVLTSSFAAVGYGHPAQVEPFTEATWTNLNGPGVAAYMKSKTIAERAAWDFIAREGGTLELSVVNPVGVFGPLLGDDLSTSVFLLKMLLDGALPACPRVAFGVVDVRDVADLHLRAMTDPAAKGERFLAVAGPCMSLHEISQLLRRELGPIAHRVPTRELPDWVVRLIAVFSRQARQIVSELGKPKSVSFEKAQHILGWAPRSNQECILATAKSLNDLGLLKDSPK